MPRLAKFWWTTVIACTLAATPAIAPASIADKAPPIQLLNLLSKSQENATNLRLTARGMFPVQLLPRYFNIFGNIFTPNNKEILQDYIEMVITDVLSTPTGGQICTLLDNDRELVYYLGIRPTSVDRIKSACGLPFGSTALPPRHGRAKAIQAVRQWSVIIHEDPQFNLIDSYTNAANHTVLVFRPEELTYEGFLKRISHEIAIFFDEKFLIDLTWVHTYGRGYRTDTDHDDDDLVRFFAMGSQERLEPCHVLPAMSNNYISFGALSARGLQFEVSVFQDLRQMGIELRMPPEHREFLQLTPKQRLAGFTQISIPIVERIPGIFRMVGLPEGQTLCFPKIHALTEIGSGSFDYETYLRMIETWEVEVQGEISRQPLTQFMLTPKFGRDNIRINNGPRPGLGRGTRIGGGGRDGGGG